MSLITTPFSLANSYATLDEANSILAQRLWVDAWNSASMVPGARNYLVSAPAIAGATSVSVTAGKGEFVAGNIVKFGSDTTEYTVAATTSSPTATVTFTPALVAPLSINDVVFRVTPNKRESALLTAVRVLDTYFQWDGDPAGNPQEQALQWPRSGVVDCAGYPVDHETIPQFIKVAQAELAASLLQRDLLSTPKLLGIGIEEAKIPGPIEVKLSKLQREGVVPDHIITTLRCYGTIASGVGATSRVHRLTRV